jgi:alkylresorcinol/alkylpyrone synthase
MLKHAPNAETLADLSPPLQVSISSLATAVPEHRYAQDEALELASRMFPAYGRLESVFANTGIEHRYSCVPLDWFCEPHNWVDRNSVYENAALDLLEKVARSALSKAGLGKDDIGAIITVSTTGLSVPSLDAKLMHRLGLSPDTERLPIFGLGCAGGVTGLARAARLAATMDGRGVLMMCVELCGLNFRPGAQSKVDFVSCALFGDGAAGAVLHAHKNGAPDPMGTITGVGEHNWPGTNDVMGWSIEEDGFGVVMSTQIPKFARNELREAVELFLAKQGIGLDDLDGIITHPGGRKVLEAISLSLNVEKAELVHSWEVLRDYGNMSSPTVMFVLERTLAAGAAGRHLMAAFGPGFTVSFALLDICAG